MRLIESAKSNVKWVFSPLREVTSLNITSTEIEINAKNHRTPFVNVSIKDEQIYTSYSVERGYDFAKKYLREFNEDNSVYIQQSSDNRVEELEFAFVLIIKGQIQRDAILSLDQLQMELEQLQESIKTGFMSKMIVREYGALSSVNKELIESIAIDKDSITSLTAALTDTLSPDFGEEIAEIRYALKTLKQKPMSKSKVMLVGLFTLGMLFYLFQPEKEKVITVTEDPYAQYREILLKTQPEPGNRMAQAYNIQVAIEQMPGWELNKVIHSKTQSPQFYVTKKGAGSERQLEIFAKKNHMVLMQEKAGSVLTLTGANIPPIKSVSSLKLFRISDVYQVISDAITALIPSGKLYFLDYRKIDPTQNKWTTLRAAIDFKSATKEDLLKIRSITKDLPVTLETGGYQISNGRLTGSIIIQIHGEEI